MAKSAGSGRHRRGLDRCGVLRQHPVRAQPRGVATGVVPEPERRGGPGVHGQLAQHRGGPYRARCISEQFQLRRADRDGQSITVTGAFLSSNGSLYVNIDIVGDAGSDIDYASVPIGLDAVAREPFTRAGPRSGASGAVTKLIHVYDGAGFGGRLVRDAWHSRPPARAELAVAGQMKGAGVRRWSPPAPSCRNSPRTVPAAGT